MREREQKRRMTRLAARLVVVAVAVVALANITALSAAPMQPKPNLESNFIGTAEVCRVTPTQIGASVDLWTPVILLNSPYGGSATGSTSATTDSSFTFSFTSSETISTTTSSLTSSTVGPISNGAAVGLFQLDEWGWFETGYSSIPGSDNIPCTVNEVPEIISSANAPQWSVGLEPTGATTDSAEPTNVGSHLGYSSVSVYNGYARETSYLSICSPTITDSTQHTTSTSTSVAPSVSFDGYTATATWSMQSTLSTAFSYTFSSAGYWDYYTLDSSYNNGAWAFDYLSSNCNY